MAGKAKKPAAPRKKANGYKMPTPIPTGEVINDAIAKKKWKIGPSVGVGGFGEIYSACVLTNSPKKDSTYPFVIKVEPHENGPLFVEKHFYIRNANQSDITAFMKSKKLTSLGMPTYFGNGSHELNGEKYRYLVLERYGKDVWNLFKDAGRTFPTATVFQLGIQMLDVLEYIHSRGYVHADIKGSNILMGLKKGSENQAYLVDFGLAARVNDKEFKPNPKNAHNGTLEYTSTDAHLGEATMRGDLEILGYNMLQWLVGVLPWEHLKQPSVVQSKKETFMKSVRSYITKHFPNVPDALIKYFEYINTLQPKQIPDHSKCRTFFQNYLKSEGKTVNSKLNFNSDTKAKINNRILKAEDIESEIMDVVIPKLDVKNKKHSKQNGVIKKTTRKAKTLPTKETTLQVDDDKDDTDSNVIENEIEEIPKKRITKPKRTKVTKISTPPVRKYKKTTEKPPLDTPVDKSDMHPNTDMTANKEFKDGHKDYLKKNINKRKSLEPAVVVNIKKTKLAPRATPIKIKHVNINTSSLISPRHSPRNLSKNSPYFEVSSKEDESTKANISINSSGDIFNDSYEEVSKDRIIKRKKKLIYYEEITVTKDIKKKTTTKDQSSVTG